MIDCGERRRGRGGTLRAVPAPHGAAPASPRAVCGSHHGCGCWVPALSPLCHRSVSSRSPLCHRSPPQLRSGPAAPPPVPPPTLPIGCFARYFCPSRFPLVCVTAALTPTLFIGRLNRKSRLTHSPLAVAVVVPPSSPSYWLLSPHGAAALSVIGWGRQGGRGRKVRRHSERARHGGIAGGGTAGK